MKSYSERITAGQPVYLPIQGKTIFITKSSVGPALTLELVTGQSESSKLENIGKGLMVTPVGGFDGIKLSSAVNADVDFVITDGGFSIAFNEDPSVIGNTDANPIPVRVASGERMPVDIGGGTVTVTADNVGVSNTDANPIPVKQVAGTSFAVLPAQAATVTNVAPVAAADAESVLIAADATRRGLRIKNAGGNPVAIGGAGITWANAAIVIQPGETWNENEAAAAAWQCICDAGQSSTLNIQVVK